MSLIKYSVSGDFNKTIAFLEKIRQLKVQNILDSYGSKGCDLLAQHTPVRTGETASSWSYETENTGSTISISWKNTNMADDGKTPVVILIIKGHGTRTGGYVPPNDFVTPLMEPLCKELADAVWKVVTS